jgi:tetratricopeptide (TPR) repeat protein
MRYRMLETLRQYALQRLVEADEDQDIQLRHACHYADLVLRCKARLFGPEQIEAVKRIESEHNNIRAVLSYGARSPTAARLAGQVAGSVGFFWFLRNHFSEGRHWLDWVLSLESVNGTADAVWCLGADGVLTASMGDGWEGLALCDRAVSESQATSDPLAVAWAYSCRSGTHFILGNAAAAEEDGRIGMVRSAEAQWKCGQAICSAWLGRSLLMQGRLDEAAEKLHVSLDLARASGDAFSNGLAMSFYGAALGARGQYGRAAECLAGAQELFGALGCLAQQSRVLVDRATLSLHAGNVQDAASALRDALDMATELGKVPYRFAQLFTVAAHIALAQERYSDALKLVATARDLRAHSATQVSAEVIAEETALIASIDGGVGESAPHLLENIQPMSQAAAVALAYELAESI